VGSFTDKDKDNDTDAAGNPLTETGQLQDPNRRRFSRNALVGSAVLMSLGNRSAWGGQIVDSMSIPTLNSFNPSTNMFVSTPAQTRPGHNPVVARTIHDVADPPTYVGWGKSTVDGKIYAACKDPTSMETINLVQGKNCPK
jgi:hypothetical protein